MLGRNRYLISAFGAGIAITLAGIIGLLLQPERPRLTGDRGYQEQAPSYKAGGLQCQSFKLEALATRKRQAKQDECDDVKEQHRQAVNTLLEARRSADTADAEVIATYKQALIAAWSTALGLLTLLAAAAAVYFAKRAADETMRTADASTEGVRHAARAADASETTLRGVQRAFIYADRIEEHAILDSNDGRALGWQFRFPWKNSGQTPALDCEAQVNIFFTEGAEDQGRRGTWPEDLPDWWPFDDVNDVARVTFNLAPQAVRQSGPAKIPTLMLQKVFARRARLYFYGWIKYRDAFGGAHQTRFCLELTELSDEPLNGNISIGYAHLKTYNSADDQCEREDRRAFELMPSNLKREYLLDGRRPRFQLTAAEWDEALRS